MVKNMEIFKTWQIYLIGYLILMVIFGHNYKKAVKNSQNDCISTILLQLIGAVSILFFLPADSLKLPQSPTPYMLLLAVSVFYALNNKLQTTARRNLEVSTFSVFNQLTFVFVVFLGAFFLGDGINVYKILAVILILVGNSALLIQKGKLMMGKYVLVSVFSSLTASLGVVIGVGLSKNFNLPMYISLTFALPALLLLMSHKVKLRDLKNHLKNADLKSYLIAGTSWGLSIFCSLSAMHFGKISEVAPLMSLSILVNVLYAYFLARERGMVSRKVFASALITLGVYVNSGFQG